MMRRAASVLIVFLVLLTGTARAAGTLIAMLVADTDEASRTTDRRATFNVMRASAREFASFSGLAYTEAAFTGSQLSYASVVDAVRNQSCGSDDTMLFMYEGHGIRATNNSLGNLYFRNEDKPLSLKWVSDTLTAGCKPRLLLVFSGACNDTEEFASGIPDQFVSNGGSQPDRDKYRKLFRDAQGSVVVTAAQPGHPSYTVGTNVFLQALSNAVATMASKENQSDVDWRTLLAAASDETRSKTSTLSDPQTPLSRVSVTYRTPPVPQSSVADVGVRISSTMTWFGSMSDGSPSGIGKVVWDGGYVADRARFVGGRLSGFYICSNRDADIDVAVAYSRDGDWTAFGWYHLKPKGCAVPTSTNVSNMDLYYLVRGKSMGGSSASDFCVDNNNRFSLVDDDDCSRGGLKTSMSKVNRNQPSSQASRLILD